ncbi:MAG: hypothetical protein GXO10_04960 [Crenarchaeota archaeon]|nr:hypothetical protein [Thermoproteota archaeon]
MITEYVETQDITIRDLPPKQLIELCKKYGPETELHQYIKQQIIYSRRGEEKFLYLKYISNDPAVRESLKNINAFGVSWIVAYCSDISNDDDMVQAMLKHNPNLTYYDLAAYLEDVEDRMDVRLKLVQSDEFLCAAYHKLALEAS